MLSVLIPVYNYDVRALVNSLHEQLISNRIDFEIICQDDLSKKEIRILNTEIEQLQYSSYYLSNENLGRIATRQGLAEKAKYDWLLFLDADVMPVSLHFIKNYIAYFSSEAKAIYGGIAYETTTPKDDFKLRWTYGKAKEQLPAANRNHNIYKHIVSANFLIQKSVFTSINSQIKLKGYGYDNYFGSLLKQHQVTVMHIDNEVYHLGLETSKIYLSKVKEAIDTLLKLNTECLLSQTDNSLLNTFKTSKKWKLNYLFSWIYKRFNPVFERHLLGQNPSVFYLQCYKLSYICYQDLNS